MECIFHDMRYDAQELDRFYQMTANAYGVEYLSGADVKASIEDGVHLDTVGNQQLASLLHKKIQSILQ